MAKTFYPGYLTKLDHMWRYHSRWRKLMQRKLALDAAHKADLDALEAAILNIRNSTNAPWSDYVELP